MHFDIRLVPSRKRLRPAGGFTLLELLLVLALIVVMTAIVAPAFFSTLDTQRVRKSADLVRAELAKARNQAMRTGHVHVFRYEIGGDGFFVQPWIAPENVTADAAMMGGSADAALHVGISSPFDVAQQIRRLPETVIFAAGQTQLDARDLSAQQNVAASGVSAAPMSEGIWSQPILFYPDGRTSTAEVVLQNRRQEMVAVRLRGLTGTATTADVPSLAAMP